MKKAPKILFLIVGVIFPIFIGALHTFTHFNDLLTPEIHDYLQKEVMILGQSQTLWKSWGIVSFMMGISFVTIGLLNLSILNNTPKNRRLPLIPIIAMGFYQICVVYVGFEFSNGFQLYGGIFGFVLTFICLFLTIKTNNNPHG